MWESIVTVIFDILVYLFLITVTVTYMTPGFMAL
jgi:hypothetical protein